MLNNTMLRKVRDAILADRTRFDMSVWIKQNECGTSACVAGFACLVAGDTPIEAGSVAGSAESYQVQISDGRVFSVEDRAIELLGLSEEQAFALFHCSNDDALRALDKLIAQAEREGVS